MPRPPDPPATVITDARTALAYALDLAETARKLHASKARAEERLSNWACVYREDLGTCLHRLESVLNGPLCTAWRHRTPNGRKRFEMRHWTDSQQAAIFADLCSQLASVNGLVTNAGPSSAPDARRALRAAARALRILIYVYRQDVELADVYLIKSPVAVTLSAEERRHFHAAAAILTA